MIYDVWCIMGDVWCMLYVVCYMICYDVCIMHGVRCYMCDGMCYAQVTGCVVYVVWCMLDDALCMMYNV